MKLRAVGVVRYATLLLVVFGLLEPAMFLGQDSGNSQPLEFTGTLVLLTRSLVAIKLPDGRIIEAAFGRGPNDVQVDSISRSHYIGDVARLKYWPMSPRYDEIEDKAALASRHRFNPRNLLKLPGSQKPDLGLSLSSLRLPETSETSPKRETGKVSADEFLEQTRLAVKAYLSGVANFIADETATRYQANTVPPEWKKSDVVRCEVRFTGNREERKSIFEDDQPWAQPYAMLPGFKLRGSFGEKLKVLFDPARPVNFIFLERTRYENQNAWIYSFSAPRDGLTSWYSGYQHFWPSFNGKVTIDEDHKLVLKIESKASGFPEAFPISSEEEIISWDWVKAGSSLELLPTKVDVLIVQAKNSLAYLNRILYRNHRHFQASSSVNFEDSKH